MAKLLRTILLVLNFQNRGGQGNLIRKVVVALSKSIFFGIINNILRRTIMRKFYAVSCVGKANICWLYHNIIQHLIFIYL
jgi:hypothetical protein